MSEQPGPAIVGRRAAATLATITEDPDFARLKASTVKYAGCWDTFTGYPIVCEWDLEQDAPPLFVEAMRVLALKAAVYDLTDGSESAAELVIPAPVDEMIHAVLAQFTLAVRIIQRTGVSLVHMTDQEEFGFDAARGPGAYSVACYQAAGWGTPPERYWVGGDEARRRLAILDGLYQSIGVRQMGRRHRLTFDRQEPVVAAAG